ncbi:RNA polymerase sigma factor [Periweissella fabalis]|uniref:Sigma-70 family RNA polymerase sigma factor n=1 Tax=Periweissella fabalis TaxID=1070421 RepID=A0A7X6S382_9LACO|nr:sigma-70 family RNA polymerase sigma factor [Periweissella fabalis]MCM0598250.1 sigma-70 family RNA polymerase sigma factor [Periweissella fabalis]NKZ24815.1 sigma-70 family RNA polymerase sigma factor [Periweissella fabalis]
MTEYIEVDLLTLIEQAQKGDEDAFGRICAQFRPLYLAQWVKFRNLKIEKDDWFQEMQMITYKCVLSFKTREFKRSFGNYLRCAINFRCIDEWRRQKAKLRDLDKIAGVYTTVIPFEDGVTRYGTAQDLLLVREAVEQFTNGQLTSRERYVLNELVGLVQVVDYQNVTKTDNQANRRMLTRSRAHLRKKLEELLE